MGGDRTNVGWFPMTYITTSAARGFAPGAALARFLDRTIAAMARIAESDPRFKRLEILSKLSDEELAARGLLRTDIVRQVLGDRLYI